MRSDLENRCYHEGEYGEPEGQAVLSRALAAVTGRRTKELITDRRMLEAARLLRFTDLSIGEVASRSGFDDQLYFSRSFKQYHRLTPTRYRDHIRGLGREEPSSP